MEFKDLYSEGVFSTFSHLSQKFNLPGSSRFRYFQIQHFMQNLDSNFPSAPQPTAMDDIFQIPFNLKGLIARIYSIISSLGDTSLNKIKGKWEEELGLML